VLARLRLAAKGQSSSPPVSLSRKGYDRRGLNQDPFGPVLIVEVAGRARMADRDYALDPEMRR
jgi:hypothetical protein